MSETTKKRAEIISTFTDEGTGQRFTAGDTPLIEAGAFANYEHAGLVRAPAVAAKPADKPKAKSKPKAARPSRARPGPTVPADPVEPPATDTSA
jgi:hypothetical protein